MHPLQPDYGQQPIAQDFDCTIPRGGSNLPSNSQIQTIFSERLDIIYGDVPWTDQTNSKLELLCPWLGPKPRLCHTWHQHGFNIAVHGTLC